MLITAELSQAIYFSTCGISKKTSSATFQNTQIPETGSYLTGICKRDARHKAKYQGYFNKCKGTRPLSTLGQGDRVRIKMDGEKAWQTTAKIHQQCDTPRSYIVETSKGATLRRNRRHLQAIPGRQAQTAVVTKMCCQTQKLKREHKQLQLH